MSYERSSAVSVNREAIAKIIYDAFPFVPPVSGPPSKPEWVPGGNSFMQDEARTAADTIILVAPRLSAVTNQPVAWLCTDERYPYIKGIVTTYQETVDAWRDDDIRFAELGPIAAPQAADSATNPVCDLQALLEIRDFLQDIATGGILAPVSRQCAKEFVAIMDSQYRAQWEGVVHAPAQEPALTDVRWAVNVLLETIAKKFEEWETMDLWRSDAASTVRSFKHDLSLPDVPQALTPKTADELDAILNSEDTSPCTVLADGSVYRAAPQAAPSDGAIYAAVSQRNMTDAELEQLDAALSRPER